MDSSQRSLHLVGGHSAFLDTALEQRAVGLRSPGQLHPAHVLQPHLHPVQSRLLRDLGTHRAGANDREASHSATENRRVTRFSVVKWATRPSILSLPRSIFPATSRPVESR